MYLHSNILTMSMLSFYGYGNFLIHFFWADFFFLLINVTKQSFCTIFFTFLLIRTSRAENLWGFSHPVIIPNLGWILTSDGPFKLHITTLLLYEKLTDRGYLIKCFHSFVTIPYEISFYLGNAHRAIYSRLLGFSSTERGPSTPPLEILLWEIVQKYYKCSAFNFLNIPYVTL